MLQTIREISFPEDGVVQIEFDLPQGHTAKELADATKIEIAEIIRDKITFGKIVRLYGRMTTGMAAVLGHELSHVSKAVEIFDPKENIFYRVVGH